MDDITFNYGLDNPKQQVPSSGHTTIQAAPEDMFSDDLAALKMRLRSMESSLNYLNSSQAQRESFHVGPGLALPANNLSSAPSAGPTGPLFWPHLITLRTEVQGLDTRVAELEQSMSHLEDRVDGLDPSRFTPPGSNTTYASMPWRSESHVTSASYHAPELRYDNQYQQYSPTSLPHPAPTPKGGAVGNARYYPDSEATNWTHAPAGVAFRDREIARLEDILSRMQNDAQDSEELIDHKNRHIDQLAYQQGGLQSHITELQQTLRAYGNIFAMNRKEFENQRVEHWGNDAQLAASERHVQELQDALSRAASNHQVEVDEMLAEKEDELCKLREFADRKDDIVRQQGAVIARGATIIQERDDTIERLSKELKISIDDCHNATRERERTSRFWGEKMAEIARLEDVVATNVPKTPAAEPASSVAEGEERHQARSTPITPLAFDAQKNDRQQSDQWTPQNLDKYTKLPHEQRRAAAWETGPESLDTGKFGQAGKISLRHSESLKLLRKLALDEEVHGTALPGAARLLKPRYKLPLDANEGRKQETCEVPPVLPPRLSTSRNDVETGHSPTSTSTHQRGCYDKPRRSLQAYVEAEDSREKRGDAA